jgi:hypothetical protein
MRKGTSEKDPFPVGHLCMCMEHAFVCLFIERLAEMLMLQVTQPSK